MCEAPDPEYVAPCEHEWVAPTCEADGYCSKCNKAGESALGHNFVDGACTVCEAADPDYVAPCEHEWVAPTCQANGYCSKCNEVGEDMLAHLDADGNFKCDTCEAECIPDTHEKVSYALNISDLETGTLTSDSINGVFTILSGSEIRNRSKTYDGVAYSKSVKIGNSTTKIAVNVPGNGKLSFLIQNGSSGADMQFVTVTAPDGTVYDIEFVGNVEGSPVVKIELDVTEGVWTISRGKNGGTQDVFALDLACVVEKSEESGFALVAEGKTNYLVGAALSFSDLRLNATFSNGKTEPLPLENVTVDASLVNTAVSGVYPVTVTYKDYPAITFNVKIFAPESLELGFDAIEKIANSSAGNGVYFNQSFKELYFVGDTIDTTGLTVTVVAKCGEETLKFIVTDYTVTGFDSTSADMLTLTVLAEGISAQIEISVTDAVPTPDENGVYQLLVDPAYEGLPGYLSGPYHTFKTIQESLDFAAKLEANAEKVLSIAPGYYNEKLEITVPNLKIVGWGETPDEVVIEWNSLYGLLDASGFSHVTDSTATVAVRESAYNVTMENITISNYWNSQERMDAAGIEIERGLALLVQADRFTMTNSKLLGIQDTLELFTGRQYFENVYISGYTDFIFGTNNTTLFKNCTIHVIDTAKDDKGTAGYITAFKGSNKGANDTVVYGAIFDGCKFTADAGVTEGCTAIGRTWAAYAAVAVINSELGGHISLQGYSTNKNERYVSMNGKPTDSTVNFVEFNNTGAGALTEAVAGMRFLTAEEAALYTNMEVIFGTVNGNVSYLDAWMPGTAPVADDRTYYYFNGVEGTSGTSYTYSDNIQGAVVEWEGLVIDATTGKLTARGSDAQFNQGAKIILQVEAGTLVTVVTYPGYGFYTINGIAHNANDTFSVYFATATEVVIEATGTSYLYQIIVNPNEEAPADPTLNEIKVSGLNVNYNVGDEFNLDGVVVKAYYSDNSVVTLTDYSVDASAVNTAAAGAYDVVFTYGDKTVTLTVNFAGADDLVDFDITFGSDGNYKDSGVDFSGIQIRDNGGNNSQIHSGSFSFDVKAGAVVTVNGYSGYTSYTLGDGTTTTDEITAELYTYTAEADVTITITPVSTNNYFYSISVTYPAGGDVEEPTPEEPEKTEWSFDATAELEAMDGGSKADGETQSVGTDGFFTIYYGAKTKIDSSSKTFADGYTGSLRLNMQGKTVMGATPMYAIGFEVNGAATVTIWWACGGDGREIDIYDANGNIVYTTAEGCVKNSIYISTIELAEGGKYFIGSSAGSNYYFRVDVKAAEAATAPVTPESFTISFGNEGNYKETFEYATLNVNVGDNGDNSQVKEGTITLQLFAGATVTVNGYPGYTSYTLTDASGTTETITEQTYEYVAEADGELVLTPVGGNNYLYSIVVAY